MKDIAEYTLDDRSMLYTPSRPTMERKDVHDIVLHMYDVMYHGRKTINGVGLAANQIGLDERIIVVDIPSTKYKQVFINPVIRHQRGPMVFGEEGCLSYPHKFVKKCRYREIIVEAYDENWNLIKRKLRNFNAAVVQHEIDHLEGITICKEPEFKPEVVIEDVEDVKG